MKHKTCVSTYTCKRYNCLYHAAKTADNGCDYCLIEGHSRGCDPGKSCNKYKFATPEDREAIAIMKYTADTSYDVETYLLHNNSYLNKEDIW